MASDREEASVRKQLTSVDSRKSQFALKRRKEKGTCKKGKTTKKEKRREIVRKMQKSYEIELGME